MDTTMETMILLVGEFFSALFLWIGIALLAEQATISAFQKRFVQIFCALLKEEHLLISRVIAKNQQLNVKIYTYQGGRL